MSDHLERVETLLAKLTNGTANRLIWFLVAAVIFASLGDRALDLLLRRFGP
jgi:hypothetical protein